MSHKVFDDIRRSDFAALAPLLSPQLKTSDANVQLGKLHAFIPNGEPRGRKNIGWNSIESAQDGTVVLMSDEYDFGDRFTLAQTRLHRLPGHSEWLVEGFHVQTATTHELAVNRFSLTGRSAGQLIFLVMMIASPVLMITALVKVIRSEGLKRKWLWGIVAFLGLFSLQMNWASGQLATNFLTVQLLDAGIWRGASQFSPWFLTMTLPIGAVLILTGIWANPDRSAQARRLRKEAAEP